MNRAEGDEKKVNEQAQYKPKRKKKKEREEEHEQAHEGPAVHPCGWIEAYTCGGNLMIYGVYHLYNISPCSGVGEMCV